MKSWTKVLAVSAAIFTAGMFSDLQAVEMNSVANNPDNPPGYENYWNRASRKLGRGISNAGLGALEIPVRLFQVNFEEGGIAAYTYGVLNGIGYFIAREVIGVVDVATFYMPLPGFPNDPYETGWGFGPVIQPEWIISPEMNYYNIVYPKTSNLN